MNVIARLLPLLAVALVSPGTADEMPDRQEIARYLLVPVFETLDCTDQGAIESGEVDTHFPSLFGWHDTDRDSTISRTEFVATTNADRAHLSEAAFADMDADGDGQLTIIEYRRGLMSLIESMDGDGDGEVTMAELSPPDTGDKPPAE